MKRIIIILALLLAATASAGPVVTGGGGQAINPASSPTFVGETLTGLTASLPVFTNASKALVSGSALGTTAYTTTAGSFTCTPLGGLNICSVAAAVLNNGVLTLPTATAGWPLRCEIETGDDADSALFTVASGGTASPISSSAGIVFNLATASKVQVGAVAPANPLIITNASGGTLNIWVSCKYK